MPGTVRGTGCSIVNKRFRSSRGRQAKTEMSHFPCKLSVIKKREHDRDLRRDWEEVLFEAGKSLCHLPNAHHHGLSLLPPFYGKGGCR